MASLEDYDEFGNYIGADLESDEEDGFGRETFAPAAPQEALPTPAPLEGFDEEPVQDDSMALMEVDGSFLDSSLIFSSSSIKRAHA